ncbi:unnamed protein product, partial [Dovyalis caffra]
MLGKNVMPNAVTLASIPPACNPVVSIDLGKQLHGVSIWLLLGTNIFVSTSLVDMYSKSGAINYAESKNSATYTTMILGYGQHGMGERALSMFHSMQKSGFEPDAITFIAILSACSHSGLVDEAYEFVKQLGEAGNVLEIWGSLLGACRLHGHVELGEVVAKKLLEMEKAAEVEWVCAIIGLKNELNSIQ